MPQPTATIDRAQRDGLYELIRNHLGAIGDIWIALEKDEEYMLAERLGLEFGEDFRLLADIGWDPDDDRQSFELTMEAHDLMEALRRLHGEAEHVLAGSRAEREAAAEDARTNEYFQVGRDACEALLSALDPRAGERR
ncbi:MAG: hypothetical protein ACM3N0_06580 [Chloroflexota bacterium]